MNYKPHSKSAKRKSRGNTLLGIFIGLALGLVIAVGIALYVSKMPSPFDKGGEKPISKKEMPAKALEPVKVEPEKHFDFYRILPGQEVPVSDKELQQQTKAASKDRDKSDSQKEPYLVQAGAFQSPTDADAMKAKLALLGLEASVEPAHLQDKGTLYRVRLGPYTDLAEINNVRQTLSQNGISASLVKSRKE
ncbi:MAG TPA: SPOR domain-containing protein [Burkholderiales bacterium]|nr:SPOR domain-containing protein [Burkholderiales bacterium]